MYRKAERRTGTLWIVGDTSARNLIGTEPLRQDFALPDSGLGAILNGELSGADLVLIARVADVQ